MTYAQMLDIPFAFSANGDGFVEHDFLTGLERQFGMDEFPTEDELIARYKAESNNGQGLSLEEETVIAQPYYTSHNTQNNLKNPYFKKQSKVILYHKTRVTNPLRCF